MSPDEEARKERTVQIVEMWCARSSLQKTQIAARAGFRNYDAFYKAYLDRNRTIPSDPDQALALIRVFRALPEQERCTAREAYEFLHLIGLPFTLEDEARKLFPTQEWDDAAKWWRNRPYEVSVPRGYIVALEEHQKFVTPDHFDLQIPYNLSQDRRLRQPVEVELCTIGLALGQNMIIFPGKLKVSRRHARICARVEAEGVWRFRLYDGSDRQPSRHGTYISKEDGGDFRGINGFYDLQNGDLIGLAVETEDVIFLRFAISGPETPM